MPLLVSCTNRKRPEIITIVEMIITANGSASGSSGSSASIFGPASHFLYSISHSSCSVIGIIISVIDDIVAKQNKIAVNGLIKAFAKRCDNDLFLP